MDAYLVRLFNAKDQIHIYTVLYALGQRKGNWRDGPALFLGFEKTLTRSDSSGKYIPPLTSKF